MTSNVQPRQLLFDSTPEIFATDSSGRFFLELKVDGNSRLDTATFDEIRFVFSVWHPTERRTVDLDRAYMEIDCNWSPDEERWVKLAEIEPVVPPYNPGQTFDGWIVLPVVATSTAYALSGGGFAPRARLQVRASAYLVA